MMRIMVRRLLALLLICSLIMTVSATGGGSDGRAVVPPEDWVTGDGTHLFSMNAAQVKYFLKSNSSFRPLSLDSDVESIYYCGTVYSSNAAASGNYRVYVGIGYINENNGDFEVMHEIEIEHGVYFGSEETRMDISEFVRTRRYYAFVRNDYPADGSVYAWGNVHVYSSTLSD